ncbi:MAG: HlyD family secretion protein [Phycisphaerae bacterium]
MNKWIWLFIGVAIIVGTWWGVRENARFTPVWDQPKYGEVSRGEIRVPVTATGLIEPYQRIEVKPEASGEVIEIKVQEGDFVKTGDVILTIKQDDEERNVTRAKAQLDRAKAQLAGAHVDILTAKANIITSEARLEEAAANLERAEFDDRRARELGERGTTADREMMLAKTGLQQSQAQRKFAEASLENARHAVTSAEQRVKIADAAVLESTKTHEDALERLNDTTIVARGDSIVAEVRVEKGTIVQSGIGTVTGGSVLVVLADVSKIKVVTRVDEADYGRVSNISPFEALPEMPGFREAISAAEANELQKRSGEVKIFVEPFPERTFTGRINLVEPQGKLNSGASVIQFDVHVEITDPDKYLLPLGIQAQVEFTLERAVDALLVPAEAVKSNEGEKGIWIPDTPPPGSQWGKKFVRCRFGMTDGVNSQIIDTLDGVKLEPKQKVYVKLPVDREEKK